MQMLQRAQFFSQERTISILRSNIPIAVSGYLLDFKPSTDVNVDYPVISNVFQYRFPSCSQLPASWLKAHIGAYNYPKFNKTSPKVVIERIVFQRDDYRDRILGDSDIFTFAPLVRPKYHAQVLADIRANHSPTMPQLTSALKATRTSKHLTLLDLRGPYNTICVEPTSAALLRDEKIVIVPCPTPAGIQWVLYVINSNCEVTISRGHMKPLLPLQGIGRELLFARFASSIIAVAARNAFLFPE